MTVMFLLRDTSLADSHIPHLETKVPLFQGMETQFVLSLEQQLEKVKNIENMCFKAKSRCGPSRQRSPTGRLVGSQTSGVSSTITTFFASTLKMSGGLCGLSIEFRNTLLHIKQHSQPVLSDWALMEWQLGLNSISSFWMSVA